MGIQQFPQPPSGATTPEIVSAGSAAGWGATAPVPGIVSAGSAAGWGATGALNRVAILTNTQTWTHPETASPNNPKLVRTILVGGGGGGSSSAGGNDSGGSGGGGGYVSVAEAYIVGSIPVVVGAGGSAGVAGPTTTRTPGGIGGTTTALTVNASGGLGGGNTGGSGGSTGGGGGGQFGGNGGAGGNSGQPAPQGTVQSFTAIEQVYRAFAGAGGAGVGWDAVNYSGGAGIYSTGGPATRNAAGSAGTGIGAGGGGGGNFPGATRPGGAGSAGAVIIYY